jgi:hypothetical protein
LKDDIKEEIIEDEEVNFPGGGADIEGIGASGSLGIDQSIDTLRLDDYDYVEDIH